MILISHRGNISGRIIEKENSIEYIESALEKNYDVEIDVWKIKNKLYLGHDQPENKVSKKFLENEKLWCHAKNIEALEYMIGNKNINCFWHQKDDYTLTSNGFIWAYPGRKVNCKSIVVMPETFDKNFDNLKAYKMTAGICSDNIGLIKEILENKKGSK